MGVCYAFVSASLRNRCGVEAMLTGSRSVVPLIRKCAVLLLAFSVFGFGLQARLAAYNRCPPNPSAAKISTEKRSGAVLQAVEQKDDSPNPLDRLEFAFLLSGFWHQPIVQPAKEQAEISLRDPRRSDLNVVYSVHGPPTTIL
jgi:hypothetical protein